jgi:hypothetical protein
LLVAMLVASAGPPALHGAVNQKGEIERAGRRPADLPPGSRPISPASELEFVVDKPRPSSPIGKRLTAPTGRGDGSNTNDDDEGEDLARRRVATRRSVVPFSRDQAPAARRAARECRLRVHARLVRA